MMDGPANIPWHTVAACLFSDLYHACVNAVHTGARHQTHRQILLSHLQACVDPAHQIAVGHTHQYEMAALLARDDQVSWPKALLTQSYVRFV